MIDSLTDASLTIARKLREVFPYRVAMRRNDAFRRPGKRSVLLRSLSMSASKSLGILRFDLDGMTSHSALFPDHFSDPIGVAGFVSQHMLAGCQPEPDRQAVLIGKRMYSGD